MINDATIEDVEGTEITEVSKVMSSGARAHGVPRRSRPDRASCALEPTVKSNGRLLRARAGDCCASRSRMAQDSRCAARPISSIRSPTHSPRW